MVGDSANICRKYNKELLNKCLTILRNRVQKIKFESQKKYFQKKKSRLVESFTYTNI